MQIQVLPQYNIIVEGTKSITYYHLMFAFEGTEQIFPVKGPPGSQGDTPSYASMAAEWYVRRMQNEEEKY